MKIKTKKHKPSVNKNPVDISYFDDCSGPNNDPHPPPNYECVYHDGSGTLIDIILRFGSWVDSSITEMLEDPAGRNYITKYLLSEEFDFPFEFQDQIREIIENYDD